jgi:hypothetical protein
VTKNYHSKYWEEPDQAGDGAGGKDKPEPLVRFLKFGMRLDRIGFNSPTAFFGVADPERVGSIRSASLDRDGVSGRSTEGVEYHSGTPRYLESGPGCAPLGLHRTFEVTMSILYKKHRDGSFRGAVSVRFPGLDEPVDDELPLDDDSRFFRAFPPGSAPFVRVRGAKVTGLWHERQTTDAPMVKSARKTT